MTNVTLPTALPDQRDAVARLPEVQTNASTVDKCGQSYARTIFTLRIIVTLLLVFLWCGLPIWIYSRHGFTGIEKLLTSYVLPVGFAWNALLSGAVVASIRRWMNTTVIFLVLFSGLALVGNNKLAGTLMCRLESRFETRSPEEFSTPFRAIVMLGGCARRLPNGDVEVNALGQRIVATAEFWHAEKTQWIITTGRQPGRKWNDTSLVGQELLTGLGIPSERILRIPGKNTHHEIQALKTFLENPPEGFAETKGDIGIVTSSFHMPRVMRLAESVNVELVPLPSGHQALPARWHPMQIVPTVGGIGTNSLVLHEFLARLVGR